MKEPSAIEVKLAFGLPGEAKFIGWLIHQSSKDEFLSSYQIDESAIRRAWGESPEYAKRFKTYKKAKKVLMRLNSPEAVIVAAYDSANQILVATPEV